MKLFRKYLLCCAAALLLVLASACGPGLQTVPSPSPADGALLTIDGYPVEEEEYLLFLQDQRALTAAWFGARYGAQVDEGFWRRDFDGQTPEAYAKRAALARLISVKIEAILLCERGLLDQETLTYTAFLDDMEATNAQRQAQRATGEPVYGLLEYEPTTYYSYLASRRHGELLRSQYERTAPTDAQLRALYSADPSLSAGEVSLTCRVRDEEDGTETLLDLAPKSIGKENTEGQRIYEALSAVEPGTTLGGLTWNERPAEVTLLTLSQGEALTFEEAGDLLRQAWAEQELALLIAQRADSAQVVLDQAAYDAITIT